jgi:uncharacterized lipoprotein YmbA
MMGPRLAPLLLAFSLAACVGTSPAARFYLLTPLDDALETTGPGAQTVRLSTVELPRYLATPEIVVRTGDNELHLASYDRWGEPLQDSFARVLAKNLAILLPDANVSRFLWEWPGKVDRQVTVAVQRFDVADGKAVLEARWALYGADGETTAGTGRARFVHAVEGEGYAGIVAALSDCVSDLSREIANNLR